LPVIVTAVSEESVGQVLEGVWQFEAEHPEWSEWEGGEDGWDPGVAWWIVSTPAGLVLVDPLVEDWREVDRLVEAHGRCAGIVRTCHWHQRAIAEAAARYGVEVWSKAHSPEREWPAFDRELSNGGRAFGDAITAFDVERDDELALWYAPHRALIFGDAMLRRNEGQLRVCPPSWTQPAGGHERLRSLLRGLAELPVEHVLVSHGPLVLGGGLTALRAATG
jgi:glyoxylase-like metal-dependent hydrolase (beta-lactamase superfamily II)